MNFHFVYIVISSILFAIRELNWNGFRFLRKSAFPFTWSYVNYSDSFLIWVYKNIYISLKNSYYVYFSSVSKHSFFWIQGVSLTLIVLRCNFYVTKLKKIVVDYFYSKYSRIFSVSKPNLLVSQLSHCLLGEQSSSKQKWIKKQECS